jgi:hypothetical protein
LIPINNERLIQALRDWKEKLATSQKEPTYLGLLLENNYTNNDGGIRDGFMVDTLDGLDDARASALKEACRATGCSLFMSTVTSKHLRNASSDYDEDDE